MNVAIKILLGKRWNADEARRDCRLRKATEFARRCQCNGRPLSQKNRTATRREMVVDRCIFLAKSNVLLPFPQDGNGCPGIALSVDSRSLPRRRGKLVMMTLGSVVGLIVLSV